MRLVAAVLGVIGAAGCNGPRASAASDAGARAAAAAPSIAPSSGETSLLEDLERAESLYVALRVAKPFMRDQAENKGAYMLVIWGMRHPSWSRFAPQKDETTYSLAQKDIDSARGGRLCVSGTIAEISTEKSEAGRFYDGLMFDPLMHIFSFKAVGSSGALVEHSQARFCGAVVGKHDYANSAGGTGHAIDLVGMFDLPENKMAQETAAEPQTRPAKAPPVAPSPPVSRKITLCRDACDANYQSQSARSDCYNACDAL